jgi:hypothetical protein
VDTPERDRQHQTHAIADHPAGVGAAGGVPGESSVWPIGALAIAISAP